MAMRELVDRQRHLLRLYRRALDRRPGDVQVGDRLQLAEGADGLDVTEHDRSHPLHDSQEAGSGPVDADVIEHQSRARDEHAGGDQKCG
jgi:hypothetical protein